jgi:class 3 adenylate cyclase
MDLRMQYATARDGVRIAFGTAGEGRWIVRAPSLPFSHSQLEWSTGSEFFDRLAENWSIAQFDPRGTGLSDREVADYSLDARALDLEAVADALGLDKFVLHAIGWSGPMAVTYMDRNPGRVTHLILDDSQARVRDFMNLPQIRALDQLTGEWDSFLEFLVFMLYGLGRDKAGPIVEYMRQCISQDAARAIFAAVRSDDVTGLLPTISVPTLVVQHSGMSQSVDNGRELAATIPGARLVVLEGGVLDSTDRVIAEIADLLGTTPAAPAHGHEHPHHAPSGVRTILFTDMVDHTSMMRRLGDEAGREVLREHENTTREVLRAHGGDEVMSLGDGFMASFPSPSGAVECAIDLQRAFDRRERAGEEPVRIRIGLNAGEPIEEGGDLFGATVIMASRIAGAGEAGEILASDVVRALCAGKAFLFADRGENVLRGFEDPVRVYEVRWRE